MGTKRTLVTLLKMTVAGAAGAGAALLAGNRLLHVRRRRRSATRWCEILFGGTVGLLVIAAVAVLLKVEELVPLRNRIVGAAAVGIPPVQPAVRPTPTASDGVQDTGRGTLAGDPTLPAVATSVQSAPGWSHARSTERTSRLDGTTVSDRASRPR